MTSYPIQIVWRRYAKQYWPELLTGCLALVVVLVASLVVHQWRQPFTPPAPVPTISAMRTQTDTVMNIAWFGSAAPPESVQAASIALVLVGTIASSHSGQGFALLGPDAHQVKVYAPNDALPGGAQLLEVYADHVIIQNNQRRESIALPQATQTGGAAQGNANRPSDTFASTLQRVQSSPSLMAEVLRPMPQFENGRLKGFKAFAGADRARFERLGLKSGDLITQVNNVPLADAGTGLEMLKSLSSAQSAILSVERDGQTIAVTIDATSLNASLPTAGPANPPPPIKSQRPSFNRSPHP
jgi:type II secretion system protein C